MAEGLDGLVSRIDLSEAASESRAVWAAMMLTRDLDTLRSILLGQNVLVRNLDRRILRHAVRGAPLPEPDEYLQVTVEMLFAVQEAGPFELEHEPPLKKPRPKYQPEEKRPKFEVGMSVCCKHGWTYVDRYKGDLGFLGCGHGCLTVDVIEVGVDLA